MRDKAEKGLWIGRCQIGMLRPVRGLNTDSKEVEGEKCMSESDGKCVSEKK